MKFVVFTTGLALGILLTFVVQSHNPEHRESLCAETVFVNSFACLKQVITKGEYVDLKEEISRYIEEQKREGNLVGAGMYFRDLRNGPTMGIHEYEEYSTASLLKVPTLIAYLNLSDDEPSILSEEIALKDGFEGMGTEFSQYYAPPDELKKDTAYTVEALLTRLTRYSDNAASEMLRAYLGVISPDDIIGETYKELGLVPEQSGGDYVITVKRYASIFRILYNASYLSIEKSEKALRMLSESTFDQGLVAGVPKGTTVSHKFGERSFIETDPNVKPLRQLHDCGIIYFPENPYTLCVMTLGYDFEILETVISDISRMVYKEVESRKIPDTQTK